MNIGILGAGRMGQTLARLLVNAGHRVRLANSRDPESLGPLVAELGPSAAAGTPEEVVAFADVVVLATRWEQISAAVKGLGPWNGNVVIDTTNNRFGLGPADLLDVGGRTSSEVVAELLPGARVVKAFNHQPIAAWGVARLLARRAQRALHRWGRPRGQAPRRPAHPRHWRRAHGHRQPPRWRTTAGHRRSPRWARPPAHPRGSAAPAR